jgi:hypothetical protein
MRTSKRKRKRKKKLLALKITADLKELIKILFRTINRTTQGGKHHHL